MMKRFIASLALVLVTGAAGQAQTIEELQIFKAQALAKFATEELAAGHGLTAVRLALRAAQTTGLSEEARSTAFGALARAVSETDEFAALDADSFGLEKAFNMFGMFLPGGRYYVAAASDGPQLDAGGVILLVDAQTGKVLDRRESSVGQVGTIASGDWSTNRVLLAGSAGGLSLIQVEGGQFEESRTLSFGGDETDNLLSVFYLSSDAGTVFRIEVDGAIASLDTESGHVSSVPAAPVETGPMVSLGWESRTETLIASSFDGVVLLGQTQRIAGGRIVTGDSRWPSRLSRETLIDAESGKSEPIALPEQVGRRGGKFVLDVGSGRALVTVRGRGMDLAIVDLNDPTFLVKVEDAADGEHPIAFTSGRGHWLTATDDRILARDGQTGTLIGWYLYGDGSGPVPAFELGYSQSVMAVTQGDMIRFLRLFFEERPRSIDVSPDGSQILETHVAHPQNYLTRRAPGGEMIETPIPDLEIARVIAGPAGVVAALDEKGHFHYWPDGLGGWRVDPAIPAIDPAAYNFHSIPFLFGPDFLAIGGYGGPCGLWSLTDWQRLSGFSHAGCNAESFVFDAAHSRLAVLGGFDGNVSVYDTESGEFLAHFRKQEELTDTSDIRPAKAWFSQDGNNLHIVGVRGWQVDLNIETGALTWGEELPSDSWIQVERGGQALVTRGYDDQGSFMRLQGQDAPIRPPVGWSFGSAELSADGRKIAAYLSARDGNDRRLALIDATDGRIMLIYSLPLFGSHIAKRHIRFSPDGTWVTAFETPGHARSFPTSDRGLVAWAGGRFGELTDGEACRWFMCQ